MKRLILHVIILLLFLISLCRLFVLFFYCMKPCVFAGIPNKYVFLSWSAIFMFYMWASRKNIRETIMETCTSKNGMQQILFFFNTIFVIFSVVVFGMYLILMYIG